MTTTTNQQAIHTRLMLGNLSITCWQARRFDRRVTAKTTEEYAAHPRAGRWNKALLPNDPLLSRVTAAATAIRKEFYRRTLPWDAKAWRLVPTAGYWDLTTAIRQQRDTLWDPAVAGFLGRYSALVEDAHQTLGSMYQEQDYPSQSDIAGKFSMDLRFQPIPLGNLAVDLPAPLVAEIEVDVEKRFNAALKTAVRDVWDRLHEVVRHVAETLRDPDAIFRDSLVTRVQDTCQALAILNVTNDPDLERLSLAAESLLTTHQAKTLRKSKRIRARVARDADRILREMQGFCSPPADPERPGHRIEEAVS